MEITNEDNMQLMARYEDNHFDLAIVDPEYGISVNMNMGRRKGMGKKHKDKKWDANIPSDEYFSELFRVSKNQIICGGNYFPLPPTRGFIIWDKKTPEELSFAMCEFIWTSFDRVSKIFRQPIQHENSSRIHPTQKSVKLYEWILMNYAKEGDKILDTHLGSGSIALACHNLGYDLTACELDKEYYEASLKRLEQHQSQLRIL